MNTYWYRGRNQKGKQVEGLVDADSLTGARDLLQERGWTVYRVATVKEAPEPATPPARPPKPKAGLPLRPAEKTSMLEQLAFMLSAGVTLTRALALLEEAEEESIAVAATHLHRSVLGGNYLSKAMAGTFSEVTVKVVEAGEKSGTFVKVLENLAASMRRGLNQRGQLQAALTYPLLLVAASSAMVAFLVYSMLPPFLSLIRGFEVPLPAPTRLLIWLTYSPWPVFLALLLALAAALVFLPTPWEEQARPARAWLTYHFPGLGPANRARALSDLCRNLALMLHNGVPLLQAMKLAGRTGFAELDEIVERARCDIEEGGELAAALRDPLVPALVTSSLEAAELSGTLPRSLQLVADSLEEEYAARVQTLVDLTEPIALLFLGLVVGTILLAALLPIYQLVTVAP